MNFKPNTIIKFSERTIISFYLTRLNSCQKDLKAVPQFGNQVLISQLSEEIDFSIEMSEKSALVLSYGVEKILGNASTDIGDGPELHLQIPFLSDWA